MIINSPIGIFDSGLGGLTVVKCVLERLSQESIKYVGDEAHVPYGERSPLEIRRFALGITDFLIRQNAKLVIMACNMSSATALELARELFPNTPIVGMIEAGARAAVRLASGPIGVLATTGTVSIGAYSRTLLQLSPNSEVIEQACPKFVPLVESGMSDSMEAEAAACEYVEPLLSAGCSTIILGCTHYPFLEGAIRKVVGSEVALINPAEETAEEAANILYEASSLNPPHIEPVHTYLATDGPSDSTDSSKSSLERPDRFAELGSRFLGREIHEIQRIAWGLDLREIEWQEKMAGQTTKSAL